MLSVLHDALGRKYWKVETFWNYLNGLDDLRVKGVVMVLIKPFRWKTGSKNQAWAQQMDQGHRWVSWK
jgi:hypothetical protein